MHLDGGTCNCFLCSQNLFVVFMLRYGAFLGQFEPEKNSPSPRHRMQIDFEEYDESGAARQRWRDANDAMGTVWEFWSGMVVMTV